MTDIIDHTADRDAEMWAQWERDMAAARESETRRALQRVALDCACCGDEIPAARLAVLPATTLCVDCAEAQEQRARRYA
ncbi:molecular chaperone DnaK [Lysobacteraceae bacterium NML75-0749]|nr:molecular chaperone DnaK [Xanthomonadaceae bacterium NML75-0749]